MARTPSLPTVTLSVCASIDEQMNMRDASIEAGMTLSAWSAARVAEALSTVAKRAAVHAAVKRIRETGGVRRDQRVSMVLQKQFDAQLKEIEAATDLTPHAFMQAALIVAGEEAIRAMPPGRAYAIEKATRKGPGGVHVASVPAALKALDAQALSEGIITLLDGILALARKRMPEVIEGAPEMARKAQAKGGMVPMKLFVPDADLQAVATLLDIDHNHLLTALAMKATKLGKVDADHAGP